MATQTRRNPAISQLNQANQIVTQTPITNNTSPEDNSPQAIILKTLQSTIQTLTILTQQVAALSFNTPAPQSKKPKKKLTKAELQALLEDYLDNEDD
ncbi:hypothetical protein TNCV_242771 [Trichonephila clavipes]|uniref:Uncharacterized protein n=1 Tax=Trichonephila clavipes TaxID=2585209 RepID=A0A8X7BET5_TRICX|nr:hypothetical protein TNCV_242771 [Trichonephila clavipes]